ncbi:MAG TPA: helix-turn-helix domain-containing protein [Solirubrobacteraceae bacterium]|nr:helix-turn-helix domain-containing protein [Solirubrobacteraceae bacterium]
MAERLPLSALLSQALVAFTIELDNAWETRIPNRTTRHGGPRSALYATSLRQWSNFMRVLGPQGLTVRELERRTRAKPQLDGMRRWGYVTIGPDPTDRRPKPPERDLLVVPTMAGRRAQAVWKPLPEEIEGRWRERFGVDRVEELRSTLAELVTGLGLALPEFLTGVYGGRAAKPGDGPVEVTEARLPLSALLSQVLQAFALDYEQESRASLCFSADVLRVLDQDGVEVSRLPRLSGVSVEQIRVALGILAKHGAVVVASDPGARRRQARLTGRGLEGRAVYRAMPGEIEARWAQRFGADRLRRLRGLLEDLATGGPGGERAPLWGGLDPPPGTWRSEIPRPEVLAHYPMPRQSGHPDGA